MEKTHSVKYVKKDKWHEFSAEPLTFNDIVKVFGKEQYITIYKLYIFQPNKNKKQEFDYDEEFFSGFDLTLDTFQFFLSTLEQYTLYCMVFELESGIRFKIEENMVTVLVKQGDQKQLLKVLSLFLSEEEKADYHKIIKNQGRYVYFKNTNANRPVTKIELWNKFEACVN